MGGHDSCPCLPDDSATTAINRTLIHTHCTPARVKKVALLLFNKVPPTPPEFPTASESPSAAWTALSECGLEDTKQVCHTSLTQPGMVPTRRVRLLTLDAQHPASSI